MPAISVRFALELNLVSTEHQISSKSFQREMKFFHADRQRDRRDEADRYISSLLYEMA